MSDRPWDCQVANILRQGALGRDELPSSNARLVLGIAKRWARMSSSIHQAVVDRRYILARHLFWQLGSALPQRSRAGGPDGFNQSCRTIRSQPRLAHFYLCYSLGNELCSILLSTKVYRMFATAHQITMMSGPTSRLW